MVKISLYIKHVYTVGCYWCLSWAFHCCDSICSSINLQIWIRSIDIRWVEIPNGYKINTTISVYIKPSCCDLYIMDICIWAVDSPCLYEVSYVTASRILVRLCLQACLIDVISFISIRVLYQRAVGLGLGYVALVSVSAG